MDYTKLVESVKTHGDPALAGLESALSERHIRVAEFDVGRLFAECFGWHAFHKLREQPADCAANCAKLMAENHRLEEAAGANSSTAMLNITQQFAYQKVLDAYDIPARIFVGQIPTRPSKFKWERVPGISHTGDETGVVEEGKPYPEVGVSEDWIDTPETKKRGMVARATKEVVFFDQTGQFMDRLGYLGDWLGVNDEKRAIAAITDAGETTNNQYRYKWRNTSIATYGDNSGSHTWDNLQASNALGDYTTINTAWQLLVAILDPYTAEPQNVDIKHLCVPPALAMKAPFALQGMVRLTAPGFATSGSPTQTALDRNPVQDVIGSVQILTSQLFKTAGANDDTTWFLGDISKAVEQIENWPLTVATLGAGSQLEFDADVIFQSRVSKRSTFNTTQPRRLIKNTA